MISGRKLSDEIPTSKFISQEQDGLYSKKLGSDKDGESYNSEDSTDSDEYGHKKLNNQQQK